MEAAAVARLDDLRPVTAAEAREIHAETREIVENALKVIERDETVSAMQALDLRDEVAQLRDALPSDGVFYEIRETLGRCESFLTGRVAVWSARATGGALALAAVLKVAAPSLGFVGGDGVADALAALDLGA